MGVEMDSLEIAIETQAKGASKEIDRLYSSLGDVGKALTRTAVDVSRLQSMVTGLSKAISRMPKLDMNIKLDGSEIQKTEEATRLAADKMSEHLKKAADDMIQAYHITNVAVKKEIQDIFQSMAGGTIKMKGGFEAASKRIIEASSFSPEEMRGMMGEQTEGWKTEWADFLDFVGRHKIKYIQDVQEMARHMELLGGRKGQESFASYFDSKQGINLDTGWEELVDMFPNVLSNFEMLYDDTDKIGNRLEFIVNKIRQAKDESARTAIDPDDAGAIGLVGEDITERLARASEFAKETIDEIKRNLNDNKLMIDIAVNEEKIIADIQAAVNKASKAKFDPVQITLKVDKNSIVNTVADEIAHMDLGNLNAVSAAYDKINNALLGLANISSHSREMSRLVNMLANLAKVDMAGFDTVKFNELTAAVSGLASMPEASNNIGKLVNSLTRLARSGEEMATTSVNLPAFAEAIRAAFDTIAQATVNDGSAALLSTITRLSGAGAGMQLAAANMPALTSAIQAFFAAMAQAPVISDSTVRMTEALAQLAQRGSRLGAVTSQAAGGLQKFGSSAQQASKSTGGLASSLGLAEKALLSFSKLVLNTQGAVLKLGVNALTGFKNIGKGASHINNATASLKRLLQVALGFYGIRSLINFGKTAIQLSSDLTEVQNVVENAFGPEGTKYVDEFTKSSIANFGLAELSAKEIASRYQAMGQSMGISAGMVEDANGRISKSMTDQAKELYDVESDTVASMSVNLAKLAADMASFYNKEQSEVAESLNAVYTGMARPLRQYGIDLTQATLQEYANAQGIRRKVSEMTQAEKTMLRYQYVMSRTAVIQGDFSRTSDTWANRIRVLKQQFEVLGKTIGNVLINTFKPLIAWMNAAMAKVISFAETIANALGKIFGWTIVHTPAGQTMDTAADAMESVGDAGEDAADGTNAANKALQEYQNTVLGFDELNKLNAVPDNTGAGGSGSGSGTPGTGGVGDGTGSEFSLVQTDNLIEKYKSEIDNLYELGEYIGKKLTEALQSIEWEKVFEGARNFGTGLAKFLNGLISPELFGETGGFIANAVNTALNAADAFLDEFEFDNLGKSLSEGINRYFETFDFGLAAGVFYKAVNGIAETIRVEAANIHWNTIGTQISGSIRDALSGIKWKENVFPAVRNMGRGLAQFLNGLIDEKTFSVVGDSVANVLNSALKFLDTWGTTFEWDKFGISLAAGFRSFISRFDFDMTARNFQTFAIGILTAAREAIGGISWSGLGYKIRTAILNLDWDKIMKSVGDFIVTAINKAVEFAGGLFDFPKLAEGITAVVEALAPAGKGFAKGFSEAFENLANIGGSVLEGIGVGIQKIADALNALPPEVLETFGKWFGEIAVWIIALKGAEHVVGIVGGVAEKFLGLKTAIGEAAAVADTTATTGGFSVLLNTLGAEGLAGTLIGATVILGKKMNELYIAIRGGHGTSQEWTAFSTLITGLQESGKNVDELEPKVFGLVDDLITGKKSSEEFGAGMVTAFRDAGISGNDVAGVMDGLIGKASLTDTQVGIIDSTLSGLGTTVETTGQKVAKLDKDPKLALDALKTAVMNVADESDRYQSLYYSKVLPVLEDVDWKDDVEGAYNAVQKAIKDAGLEADASHLDEYIAEAMPTAFGQLDSSISTTDGKVAGVMGTLEQLKGKGIDLTQTGFGGLLGTMLGIGTNASDADSKSASLKDLIWKFAGGMGAQAILMAVAGTTFKTMGDKSETASGQVDKMTTAVDTVASTITDNLSGVSEETKGYAENAITGFVTPLENDTTVEAAGSDLISDFLETIHGFDGLNEHSPSKTMEGYAENALIGFVNGLTNKTEELLSTMRTIITELKTLISDEYANFQSAGETVATNFKSGMTSISFFDVPSTWAGQMNFESFYGDMMNAGANAATSFSNGMRRVHLPIPHLNFDYWVKDTGSGYNYGYNTSISWYARGGFPNMGELFLAGEQGPEMVGMMGNRNAVANNQQITEGIRAAVVDGFMEAFMATSSGRSSDAPYQMNITMVTPDGEVLARQVEKGQMRRNSRYNPVAAF